MNKSHIRKLFFIISVFIIVLLIAPVHAVWAGQPAQTVPTQAPTKTDTAVVYYYTLTFTPYVVTATPSFTPTVTDTETETDTLEPSASPTDTAQPTDTGQPLFTLTPPALSTLSTPIILYTPTPTPTGGILAGLRSSLNWVLVICGILVLALVILIIVLVSRRKTGQTPPAEGIPPAGPLP